MNLIVIDFLSIILRMFILKKFSCYIYVYYNLRKGLNIFYYELIKKLCSFLI